MHPSVTNKPPIRYPEELNLTANLEMVNSRQILGERGSGT